MLILNNTHGLFTRGFCICDTGMEFGLPIWDVIMFRFSAGKRKSMEKSSYPREYVKEEFGALSFSMDDNDGLISDVDGAATGEEYEYDEGITERGWRVNNIRILAHGYYLV